MKKFLLSMIALMLAIINVNAQATTATITVDNADKVKITNESRETIAAGEVAPGNYMVSPVGGYKLNQVTLNGVVKNTVGSATYYMVELAAGDALNITANYAQDTYSVTFNDVNAIKSITSNGTNYDVAASVAVPSGYQVAVTLNDGYQSSSNLSFYATQDVAITTSEKPATQYATITVDDPNKVKLQNSNYEAIPLYADATNSVSAGNYMITNANSDYKINKVEKNGEAVSAPYGYYSVSLAAGDKLVITTKYDADTYNVTFDNTDVIDSIKVGGVKFDVASTVAVPTGYKVNVFLNNKTYTISSATVNGSSTSTYGGSISFYVDADKAVSITATKNVLATVKVDAGSKVKMINSSYETIALVDGEQQVSVGTYQISAQNNSYTLNKITKNGEVVSVAYTGATYYQVTLAENDVLEITANYEQDSYPVTITAANGVVKSVTVSGSAVENFVSFDGAAGYKYIVTLDKDTYSIDKVTVNGTEVTPNYGQFSFVVKAATDVVVTSSEKGLAQVIVDDANRVKLRNSSYQTVALIDGDQNQVPEGTYQISSQDGSYSINKVEVNGVEVAATYGYWTVTLKKDDVLKITTKYDADTYHVTINAPEGAISTVTTATGTVTDYTSFDSPAGYKVTITPNTSAYKINSVTVNGEAISYYGSISVTVKGETAIVIDATEKVANKFTINTNNASAIVVYGAQYSTYYDSSVKVALANDGANEVTLAQDYSYIAIEKAAGCYISSVKVGDKEYSATYGVYYVPVTNGMTVDVVCGEVVKDSKATIVLKGRETANYSFYMQDGERNTININADGTYDYEFASTNNVITVGAYGEDMSKMVVYVNGVQKAPQYEGSTYYTLSLNNNDYVEIYLAGGSSEYKPTAIDTVNANSSITRNGKYVINGKLVIVKNGKQYSANGQMIK